MKNKILIELIVPEIDSKYNVFIPVTKKVGEILTLLNKSLVDITNGNFVSTTKKWIYDGKTGEKYDLNVLVKNTNMRNGTSIILI